MISTAVLAMKTCYYPLGNTPAVCLTQDLPPNQDADILLLGCGDARNVLLTCFVDNTRKMDLTCCDIQPLIHARNILLYSMMIDDEANRKIDCIWNIYFHWKLDKPSLKLMQSQVQKLLRMSNSLDEWHASVYGTCIRFFDAKSLSHVRSCWVGFQLQGLSQSEKVRQMQAVINSAKVFRARVLRGGEPLRVDALNAAAPVGSDAMLDVCEVVTEWYESGIMSSSYASEPTDLNPAFLHSPSPSVFLHYDMNPLLGFPLSMAFAPIAKGSALYQEQKEFLIDCVKNIFAQWASAFRKAVANKLVIRIYCGDAVDLCLMLSNCQQTSQLYHGDNGIVAPLNFDVIDTSNLLDPLGLSLIVAASRVLKYNAYSCLYTEQLTLFDGSCFKRLFSIFGVDPSSIALLLGLVLPVLFTNAESSIEENPILEGVVALTSSEQPLDGMNVSRSRLRWKRSPGYQDLSIHVEAKALGNMLIQVHHAMFKHEDLDWMSSKLNDPSMRPGQCLKLSLLHYNHASFAFLLHCLQATVITDWDLCVEYICDRILSTAGSVRLEYTQDLLLNLHLYGVASRGICKPTPADVGAAVLAPRIRAFEDMPVQLCVTVRVSREQLKFTFKKTHADTETTPAYLCVSFQGGDPGEKPWTSTFSTVRKAFGSWHAESEDGKSCPYIEEDSSQMGGSSDMFVSVMVPTAMLLRAKTSVPRVRVGLILVPGFYCAFGNLDKDLYFTRSLMTSKDVYITRFLPGMSTLPGFPLTNPLPNKPFSEAITAQLSQDSSKINTLVRRTTLESQEAKDELANPDSAVEIKFKSPLIASVVVGQSQELKFEFPVPVSPSKFKSRIARKSSYIEVETPLLDPLKEDAFTFIYPCLLAETPRGRIPVPWASTYINLDAMPPLDLGDKRRILWLIEHASTMFSKRERRVHKSRLTDSSAAQVDVRTDLKDGLFSIFMHYAGLRGQQAEIFGLSSTDGRIETLIFPACLRLDLVNHTVLLDAAMIPVTSAMLSDPKASQILQELKNDSLCQVKVSKAENLAWKAMMPALVERCRIMWEHTPGCEYVKAGKVPLSDELSAEDISPICSCGIGKFPSGDYLRRQINIIPDLNFMINRYATRVALVPIFAVREIENCSFCDFADKSFLSSYSSDNKDISTLIERYFKSHALYNREKCVVKEKCAKCGSKRSQNVEASQETLPRCGKCKLVQYCSRKCQAADWQKHKPLCAAV